MGRKCAFLISIAVTPPDSYIPPPKKIRSSVSRLSIASGLCGGVGSVTFTDDALLFATSNRIWRTNGLGSGRHGEAYVMTKHMLTVAIATETTSATRHILRPSGTTFLLQRVSITFRRTKVAPIKPPTAPMEAKSGSSHAYHQNCLLMPTTSSEYRPKSR